MNSVVLIKVDSDMEGRFPMKVIGSCANLAVAKEISRTPEYTKKNGGQVSNNNYWYEIVPYFQNVGEFITHDLEREKQAGMDKLTDREKSLLGLLK